MVGALGGAAAGAIGAVRGAKVGADKTAAATRQQVRDQATAEHDHWLREQRLTAYGAFIAVNQDAERAADTALRPADRPQSRADVIAFREAIQKLSNTSSHITVLGPEEMITASGTVFRQGMRLIGLLYTSLDVNEFSNDARDIIDAAWDDYVEAGQLFQQTARAVLVQARHA